MCSKALVLIQKAAGAGNCRAAAGSVDEVLHVDLLHLDRAGMTDRERGRGTNFLEFLEVIEPANPRATCEELHAELRLAGAWRGPLRRGRGSPYCPNCPRR
jgi:hypothetical protein